MSFNSSKRKLHKSYIILWNTQLSTDGYAKCLIETCNFISSDLYLMQEHYKTCKGIENHDSNLCSSCNKWMPSKEELNVHIAECNGGLKSNSNIKLKRLNSEKFYIQGPDEVSCRPEQNINRLNSTNNCKKEKEVKFCKICEQVFSCDTDYLQHLIPCQENSKKILMRKNRPKTMKENTDKDDDSCIIQPGRDIPKEQYVRRRGFTKQHKIAWETAMRKYRHIKCMFQKCHFLAMSVEDMISHYGYCNGDGSFAEFVCPYCEGRVTSEEILKIHMLRSHSYEESTGNNGHINSPILISESKSRASLEVAVGNKNECNQSNLEKFCDINNVENEIEDVDRPNEQNPEGNPTKNCSDDVKYSNETNEEICAHHKSKIQDNDSEFKKNKCLNELIEAINDSESNKTRGVENETDFQSNKTNDPENNGQYVRQMVKFSFPGTPNPPRRDIRPSYTSAWNESIKKNGFARCLVATCNFISLDIFHIENHYKTCNGVPAEGPNLCSFCRSRLPSSIELWIHESVCRGNSEITCTNASEYQKLISKKIEDSKGCNERENLSSKMEGENQNGLNSEAGGTNNGNEISLNENEIPRKDKRNSLRISDIIKTREDDTVEDKPIIQSGPDPPPGTHYTRRRPYTKTHKAAWETALKKHKYVKCMFQNCNFLAMSLEDMIYHFGYCSGNNGSFANFECPYCKGRLTTESILDIHIQVSHPSGNGDDRVGNDGQSEESLPTVNDTKVLAAKKEIKTYGRHSRKSKSGKSINNMKETGYGSSTGVGSKRKFEKVRNEEGISVNNIVQFDPGDENVKVSKMKIRKNVSSAFNDGNKKTRENDIISTVPGDEGPREPDRKTVRGKRKLASPDKNVVTQSELNQVDDVKCVNNCKSNGGKGRKTRASGKSYEQDESNENHLEYERKKRNLENESTEVTGKKPEENVYQVPNGGNVKTESSAGPEETRKNPGKRGRCRNDTERAATPAKKKKPGRKTKDKSSADDKNDGADTVKCGRCDFTAARDLFIKHNYKMHGGLSWIVGEDAIDLSNEKEVEKIVKKAFKFTKSAECHNCGAVKKSALGFISHIKNCGKSKEEKEALKVTCPYCPARLLSYSLPMHFKLTHSGTDSGKTENSAKENVQQLPSKRKSAIRAMNKCNQVLKEYYSDDEDSKKKNDFVLFEKKNSKPPKVAGPVIAMWRKILKEKKTIECQRKGCNVESLTIQEARGHHFKCPSLPEKCYMCLLCSFYSETENAIREHVDFHPRFDEDCFVDTDDERIEGEREKKKGGEFVEEDFKVKTGESLSDETALETMYKTNFFVREKIHNERQTRFCYRSLRMTLDSELEELKENARDWPEFHTKLDDWVPVSFDESIKNLPSLQESISFKVNSNGKTDKMDYEKLARFTGRMTEDSAAFFTGGSILSMSWCKYTCIRSSSQIQYLAVSSTRKMDKYQNIHDECNDWSGLVQIWSCGEMLTNLQEVPKMAIGIVHDSGEIWDLSWFPTDCYNECENKSFLKRLGLLGGACRDGTVRIWSICDPEQLKNGANFPLYKTEPAVILELEGKENVSCMRLAIGKTGVVVGGYANGMVAAWNLNSVSSPFCQRSGNSFVLKPYSSFQAHRTSITALSICPNNDRYITTSGLDRYIKFWDFECFGVPFECIQKEICLENVWPRHWPMTISVFENVVPGAGKGMIKAIRNAYCEKHTAPLNLDGTCWGLSFNDWLNVLCGCNSIGEVKIRYLRNMFLADEKFKLRAGNLFSTTEVKLLGQEEDEGKDGKKKEKKKKINEGSIGPRSYEEASQYFGLIFKDHAIDHEKVKSAQTGKKGSQSMEDYPISSVNKVRWNPNYTSFMHLAIGYQCGLIRIKTLNDPKCAQEVSEFLNEAKTKISKISEPD